MISDSCRLCHLKLRLASLVCDGGMALMLYNQNLFLSNRKEMPIHAGLWLSSRDSRPRRSAVYVSREAGTDLDFLLLTDDLDQHPLPPPAVELPVKDLLPRTKVQSPVGDRHDDLAAHHSVL